MVNSWDSWDSNSRIIHAVKTMHNFFFSKFISIFSLIQVMAFYSFP